MSALKSKDHGTERREIEKKKRNRFFEIPFFSTLCVEFCCVCFVVVLGRRSDLLKEADTVSKPILLSSSFIIYSFSLFVSFF